jgi:hypothetical protein
MDATLFNPVLEARAGGCAPDAIPAPLRPRAAPFTAGSA